MIEKARPEDIGISPNTITKALDDIDRKKVPIHSLLMMRHGKIFLEAYWAPWTADKLHRLYSITKSFTALLIGCLEEEGKLSLDDRIVDYFPEYCPEDIHPYLASLTIRDMLMMRTCHRTATYKMGRTRCVSSWRTDWVKSFFDTAPDHAPGTLFMYDTSSSHVLACLVERLSGMDYMSYLRSRLKGISDISDDSYILHDPEGNPCGGSGVMMKPSDLVRIAWHVHSGGPGLPSPSFMQDALSPLSASNPGLGGDDADERAGYGYFFWMMSHGSAAMYGMGGQYAILIPSKDMVVVTTADTQPLKEGNEIIRRAIWDIVESASDKAISRDEASYNTLQRKLQSLSVPILASTARSKLSGLHEFKINYNSTVFEMITYDFNKDYVDIMLKYRDSEYAFRAGDGYLEKSDFPVSKSTPCYASSAWLSDGTFSVLAYLSGPEMGTISIQSAFSENAVTVLMHLYGEVSFTGFEGVFTGIEQGSSSGV